MIRVTLSGAGVGSGQGAALPPVSAKYTAGVPTLLATEGGARPTVLSLVASGRMKLDAGSVDAVNANGRRLTPAQLRRTVALIDTPLVAEHPDDVTVATVVREELALAGRARLPQHSAISSPRHGRDVGAASDQAVLDRATFGSLAADDRLRLLVELAMRRPDVEALVVTSPERHGGEPARWWQVLRETAARGIAILVVTDAATVTHLDRLGQPEPRSADAVPLFDLASPLESSLS